jgi:hypothetical protein
MICGNRKTLESIPCKNSLKIDNNECCLSPVYLTRQPSLDSTNNNCIPSLLCHNNIKKRYSYSVTAKSDNKNKKQNQKQDCNMITVDNVDNDQILLRSLKLAKMDQIDFNLQRIIRIEEITVKEKILKDEWKRKARICDGICCLLVFILLFTCSMFIFIILPTVRTASLID